MISDTLITHIARELPQRFPQFYHVPGEKFKIFVDVQANPFGKIEMALIDMTAFLFFYKGIRIGNEVGTFFNLLEKSETVKLLGQYHLQQLVAGLPREIKIPEPWRRANRIFAFGTVWEANFRGQKKSWFPFIEWKNSTTCRWRLNHAPSDDKVLKGDAFIVAL